jgi:hypothetical protein
MMAGDWIKMRTDLAEDPAVIDMAAALGDCDEDLIVGKLHKLWSWADKQSRDGHAIGVTQNWIDKKVGMSGFALAMVSTGWLEIDGKAVTFPNFDRHNGETAKTRALGSKRKQKQRASCPDDVPDSSRNERDNNETREEKRREDIKDTPIVPKSKQNLEARIFQIAEDFRTAYNGTVAKPNGVLPKCSVMNKPRLKAVKNCLPTARQMCQTLYGSEKITAEFCKVYFEEVEKDDFWSGRGPYHGDHVNWRPSFEDMLKETTMAKLFDKAMTEGDE